ncbi:FecR domain-containing protein [Bradyrhizobium sp. STM 3557]|uniref:FecR family protein n=1 Tax=Bradyrhizobium sp. STM 3557 TaxID=578920 RepID=UPI00388D3EF4
MTLHRLALAFSVVAAIAIGAPALAQAPAPAAAAAADTAAMPASAEPIGNVAALTGTVTVVRNKNSLPLRLRDDIFLNDIVQTAADSSLGITFDDGTTFRLSANAKIAIDNYVYEDGGKQNAATFNIGRGTVAFVAASVAKTGDMKIDTPTATLGIRGTTGLVEVPDNVSSARASAGNVAIKLYPDDDGHVGRIEVNDRHGASLGALTRGASGFSIRGGPAGGGAMRFAAVPLVIAPRELQRDQGFVRQVHSAQTLGRQIVSEQRAIRRANPGLAPNRGNPPAPQRPNAAPGQNNNRLNNNRPRQQPPATTTPDRRGQREGLRQGQAQPAPRSPQQPGMQPHAPQQPGARPQQPPTHAQPSDVQRARPQLQRPGGTARPMLRPRGRPIAPRDRRRDRQ